MAVNPVNLIGPIVAQLRHDRGWSQEIVEARLQRLGYRITRQTLANIECGRTCITDVEIAMFLRVFQVSITVLFPSDIENRRRNPRRLLPGDPDYE